VTTLGSRGIQSREWIDDRRLQLDAATPDRGRDAFTVGADSGSTPVAFLRSPFNERSPRPSPDRRVVVLLVGGGRRRAVAVSGLPRATRDAEHLARHGTGTAPVS